MENKKILIATRNVDKFNIIRAMFKEFLSGYEYFSLNDIDIGDDCGEEGSIFDRARVKAEVCVDKLTEYSSLDFGLIVGIDDGIMLPSMDEASPNSKEITDKILSYEENMRGHKVLIVRAFHIINSASNDSISKVLSIPFRFLGNPNNIIREEGKYPLNCVLGPLDKDKTISDMDFDETIGYYMKFFRDSVLDIISFVETN